MTDFQKLVDQAYEEGRQAYKDGLVEMQV